MLGVHPQQREDGAGHAVEQPGSDRLGDLSGRRRLLPQEINELLGCDRVPEETRGCGTKLPRPGRTVTK